MDSLQCQVNSCTNGHTSNFPAATSTARSLLVHGDVHHTGAPTLLTEHQPRQQLSAANPLRYHTPYMCHSRLSTPCPLCREMQWPRRSPGKVVMSAASPTKPPHGSSPGRSYHPPLESPSTRGVNLVVCGRSSFHVAHIEMGHRPPPEYSLKLCTGS